MRTCGWESVDPGMENQIRSLVVSHLDVLSTNLDFPAEIHQQLDANMWVIDPFNNSELPDEALIDLQCDLHQKARFQKSNYSDFWASLLDVPDYRRLAEKAICYLVQMPDNILV